jgi:hypothetical protein
MCPCSPGACLLQTQRTIVPTAAVKSPCGVAQGPKHVADRRRDRLGTLVAFLLIWIVNALLVNGEYICLDRRPVWGPPEDAEVYTSCSGLIDELLRKWDWVS